MRASAITGRASQRGRASVDGGRASIANASSSASPWTPAKLGNDLWLRALDGTTTRTVNGTVRAIDSSRGGTARQMQPGRCWEFNGSSNVVVAGTEDMGNVTQTIAFWCKPNPGADAYVVSTRDGSAGGLSIFFSWTGSLFALTAVIGTNVQALHNLPNLDDGNWHHIAVVYKPGDEVIYYYDGSAVLTDDTLLGTYTTGRSYRIGNRDGGTFWYSGELFDVRHYTDELTADEIANIAAMAPGQGGVGPSDNINRWFKCEDTAGDSGTDATGYDSSGNGNNGTITATLSSFYDEVENDFYSFENEVGFSVGDGSGGSVAGKNVPRDESDTGNDVLGASLDYSGKAPHDPILSVPCATFNGTADEVNFGATGITCTSLSFWVRLLVDNQEILTFQNATTTAVTVVGGVLTFGATLSVTTIQVDGSTVSAAAAGATLNDNQWHLVTLSMATISASDLRIGTDGSGFGNISMAYLDMNSGEFTTHFCEGDGDSINEVVTGEHGQVTTSNEAAFWANTQNVSDTLVTDGFSVAHDFDGSNDYFSKGGRLTSTTSDVTNMSVSIWCKGLDSQNRLIGEYNTTSGLGRSWYAWHGTGGRFTVRINGHRTNSNPNKDYVAAGGVGIVNDGEWHCLAFTWDNGTLKLYIDGVEVSVTKTVDDAFTAMPANSQGHFEIGSLNGANPAVTTFWDGQIGATVVEERTWDDAEVLAVKNGTIPSGAWYWPFGNEKEVNQGLSDLTQNGTPDHVNIPAGEVPTTVGAGKLPVGASLDLSGGESGSPYAKQLDALIVDLTYNQGDDDDASNAQFARVLSNDTGDDRVIATNAALTGEDLTLMDAYTTDS